MQSMQCLWRRYAYVITCTNVVKQGDKVIEVHVEGRKVKEDEKPPKVGKMQHTACLLLAAKASEP